MPGLRPTPAVLCATTVGALSAHSCRRRRRRPPHWGYDLFRDAQELLALVATFEQPPQRRRRVLQAMLHVDLVLQLSRLHPAGERADRLRSARHIIEHDEALHPSALDDQVEVVLRP